MEPLGDDEIFCSFNKLIEWNHWDRRERIKSFSKVSKQFLKVACFRLWFLDNALTDMLYDILPLSPNLKYFLSSKPLSNAHMKFLAKSCPKLLGIRLYDPREQVVEFDDFDDEGLCAVADNCRDLLGIELVGRSHVTDKGVVNFVRSLNGHLGHLELNNCVGVTDESLKVIGEASLVELGLPGCYHITDLGLEYLINGELKKNWLEVLNLAECDKISDTGIMKMRQMDILRRLDLSGCGVGITDTG